MTEKKADAECELQFTETDDGLVRCTARRSDLDGHVVTVIGKTAQDAKVGALAHLDLLAR